MARRKSPETQDRPNDLLARFGERMVKLYEERRDVMEQIRDLTAQAKDAGIHGKALRQYASRQLETDEQREKRLEYEEALADIEDRLGDLASTPLGRAAAEMTRSGAGVAVPLHPDDADAEVATP
jgi:uncharacterized protein (UPF0335 family)